MIRVSVPMFYRVRGTLLPPSGMVLIPAGSFEMGDTFNEGWAYELPVHTVYVSPFYMDQYKVTKALWDEVYSWATNQPGELRYGFDNAGSYYYRSTGSRVGDFAVFLGLGSELKLAGGRALSLSSRPPAVEGSLRLRSVLAGFIRSDFREHAG